LVEKVACINKRKTIYANSLVTAHSFRVCICCCWVNSLTFNSAELWILWTGILTCKTGKSNFCDQSFNDRRRKTRCYGLGLNMSPTPQTSYQVSRVQYVHNSENKENDWEVFVNIFCSFQICVIWRNWININDLPLCY